MGPPNWSQRFLLSVVYNTDAGSLSVSVHLQVARKVTLVISTIFCRFWFSLGHLNRESYSFCLIRINCLVWVNKQVFNHLLFVLVYVKVHQGSALAYVPFRFLRQWDVLPRWFHLFEFILNRKIEREDYFWEVSWLYTHTFLVSLGSRPVKHMCRLFTSHHRRL